MDKKLLESELQVMATKSTSDQKVAASATTTSVTDGSTTGAVTSTDQSSVTTAPDDDKRSPEPGSPDWVYADLPVPEVSTHANLHTIVFY